MKRIIALVLVLMLMVPVYGLAEIKQATVEEVKPLLSEAKKLCEPGEVTLKIMAVVNSAVDTWKDQTVMKAYEGLIPEGTTPSYFIYLEVDPAEIDVNIHPTKTEIKFEEDSVIFQTL